MTPSFQPQRAAGVAVAASELMRRKPQRLTASLPWSLYRRLQERADLDGRSLSNLVAHLLELACP
jgi:hypothetical protein